MKFSLGPWRGPTLLFVGGLLEVGFAAGTDLLFVLSHSGAGVFDCLTGERLARDYDQYYPVDEVAGSALGIGPIEGVAIDLAGVLGGKLPATTADGWRIEQGRLGADESLRLYAPGATDALTEFEDFISDLKAFGFSPTQRSLVMATTADIQVFTRALPQ